MKHRVAKFTFRKHRASGRYRSFELERHDIKLSGKVVGMIVERDHQVDYDPEGDYRISLAVKSDEEGKEWRWITLKKKAKNVQEARDFITRYSDAIQTKYKLHQFEE